MKIAKEFHWEMGHRLPEHFGLCKNIHGHSYKMIIEFEGKLDEQGMVIDFYDVEKMISPIIDELDHAFMVKNDDKLTLDFLEKLNSKKVVVNFFTTVENICKYISEKIIKSKLPDNIENVRVRVYETSEDYAEVCVATN
ncbi:MAG: 6-carboxytetrahydropterin synthase [Bacteroidetes bacterium]|nr:6-carboxytetrahydropterin synthase [Bacteroidota bacterium]